MRKRMDYNIPKWGDLFYYDDESPSGLRWKVDRVNCSCTVAASKDSVAGSLSDKGYWVVPYQGVYYKNHRVVWILNNGTIDNEKDIDHIDRQRSNNCLSNLRLVPESINRRNRKKQKSNTSNKTGVTLFSSSVNNVVYSYFRARWNEISNGRSVRRMKSFSIKEFGLLPAFAMACEYRDNKLKELNKIGYGYSDTHGM
jgi:hypothetical protein